MTIQMPADKHTDEIVSPFSILLGITAEQPTDPRGYGKRGWWEVVSVQVSDEDYLQLSKTDPVLFPPCHLELYGQD